MFFTYKEAISCIFNFKETISCIFYFMEEIRCIFDFTEANTLSTENYKVETKIKISKGSKIKNSFNIRFYFI